MGLRDEAAVFTRSVLEDVDGGFGQVITVTSPDGTDTVLKGYTGDVAQVLDPQTGQLVSGRRITAALPMGALMDAGLEMPIGEADRNSAPWVVSFADLAGKVSRFKVQSTMPDRTLGVLVCVLEHWIG